MPLIGIVDPSHREKASDTQGRMPEWLPLEDALKLSEDGKWSPWPWELLNAMLGEYQERGDRITTSVLVDHCVRSDIIKRREDYVDDLSNLYVPFRGTMIHQVLENYAHEEAIAEARFYTEVGGVEISCSPDHLTRIRLSDYKVTETPPQYNNPWANHSEQVQFNAYIARNATKVQPANYIGDLPMDDAVRRSDLPFDPRKEVATELALVYLGPKFPKVLMVEKTTDYFDILKGKQIRGKQPYVQGNEEVLKVLEPRVEMFKYALEVYPKWPKNAEKLWGGEPGWACPGYPLCRLPNCLAKRYPNRLTW